MSGSFAVGKQTRTRGTILLEPFVEVLIEVPPVCAPGKAGEGGSDVDQQSRNLQTGVQQVGILPGRAWPAAGSEPCVVGRA